MKLIEQTTRCDITKQYSNNPDDIIIWNKDEAKGNTLRIYTYKEVETCTDVAMDEDFPYPIPSTGADSYIFTLGLEWYNPDRVEFNHKDYIKQSPLHSALGVSIAINRGLIEIRFQCEMFPSDCVPWEIVTAHIKKLILARWLVAPSSREDISLDGKLSPEYIEYDTANITTVNDLQAVIVEKLTPCRVDYFRDFEESLLAFNIPSTAIPAFSKKDMKTKTCNGIGNCYACDLRGGTCDIEVNGYYQRPKAIKTTWYNRCRKFKKEQIKSRVKFYDRKDKGYDVRRFEIEITDGLLLKDFKTITSMKLLIIACKIRALAIAIDNRGWRRKQYYEGKDQYIRTEYSLWLWLDRFLEAESPRLYNEGLEPFPPKGYREKRLAEFKKQRKIFVQLYKGKSHRKIQAMFRNEQRGGKVYPADISRALNKTLK